MKTVFRLSVEGMGTKQPMSFTTSDLNGIPPVETEIQVSGFYEAFRDRLKVKAVAVAVGQSGTVVIVDLSYISNKEPEKVVSHLTRQGWATA